MSKGSRGLPEVSIIVNLVLFRYLVKIHPEELCIPVTIFLRSLSCPSNCSGRGVCDEDSDGNHVCICDDPFDNSPGCWGE